jgi:hypothetical protein
MASSHSLRGFKVKNAVAIVEVDRAQEWASKIGVLLAKTAQSVIETGLAYIAAKRALDDGEWLRMFDSHPECVTDPLRCSVSSANKFMAIAYKKVLCNSEHVPNLPASWSILYELSRVPDPTLERAIEDGTVRPDMERRDVKALLPPPKPRKPRKPRAQPVDPDPTPPEPEPDPAPEPPVISTPTPVPETPDIEGETEISPELYRTSYIIRADQAVKFAFWQDEAQVPDEKMVEWAEFVAETWAKLALKLKERMK